MYCLECRDLQEMAEVKGWFQSGHGNLSACLEEFTLCKDGSYHRLDHLGHIFEITVVPYQVDLTQRRGFRKSY